MVAFTTGEDDFAVFGEDYSPFAVHHFVSFLSKEEPAPK
jgi:hypothetical protein